MFNRVKFVVNKILLQSSKKKNFVKTNKCNNKYIFTSTRKFSSYSKGQPQPQPPNDPFNRLFLLATIFCGELFMSKKGKKN